jgi:hypothetical protein
MTLGISMLTNILALVVLNNIIRSTPRLHNGQHVDHNCKHLTLGSSILSSDFLMHTKNKKLSSQVLQYATLNIIL